MYSKDGKGKRTEKKKTKRHSSNIQENSPNYPDTVLLSKYITPLCCTSMLYARLGIRQYATASCQFKTIFRKSSFKTTIHPDDVKVHG